MGEIISIERLRRRKRKPRKQPERIKAQALMELIGNHAHSVLDHQGKCPLTLLTVSMAWELNQYFLGEDASEEDKGFRRCDQMAAAKPLSDHGTVEAEYNQCRKKPDSEELE